MDAREKGVSRRELFKLAAVGTVGYFLRLFTERLGKDLTEETKVIRYVCPDGKIVDDPNECMTTTEPAAESTFESIDDKEETMSNSISVERPFWDYRCIDTMKISRDMARALVEELNTTSSVPNIIPLMVGKVKGANANMISFGTPYDGEFIPLLKVEIAEAEKQNLQVWLRGNLSGWEGWFEYERFEQHNDHHRLTKEFILNNPTLFVNEGRSRVKFFSPSPEPENGFENVWESTQRQEVFKEWLLASYANSRQALDEIGATDTTVIFSFNGDVAKILPPELIHADHPVIIDHYIEQPEQYLADIQALHQLYSAQVGLGEFGAPIADIHGSMTEEQQAEIVKEILLVLSEHGMLIPLINYWHLWDPHSIDSSNSTALLNADGSERLVYQVIQDFFRED
jgi:hypothetical protein